MSVEEFKIRLSAHLNTHLEIQVNENRSTMLNLLERNRFFVRLSVHKMFLTAPDPVISAIAHYVRGTRKEVTILRKFIQDSLADADYTHLVNPKKLQTVGHHYNLLESYHAINKQYFNNELDLSITWYGSSSRRKTRTRITFGQYVAGLRLIKIHRMLDDPFFPDYFVNFVIYHEMVHSVVPGSVDTRGRFCFHSADFKAKERDFEHYKAATVWEKTNKQTLFKYGWT